MYKIYGEMRKLKEGQKVTIVTNGEFGGIVVMQTTIDNMYPQAHYLNCPNDLYGVRLLHQPKGKRRLRENIISYNHHVLVYDGWIEVDEENIMFNKVENNGYVVKSSKYLAYDVRYFYDVEKFIKNEFGIDSIIKINL
jgi:hypothetical protein